MERRLDAANKSAAAVQITAEQLIREASSLSRFDEPVVANAPIFSSDADLTEYKAKKRKDFEDSIRRRRIAPRVWIAYGKWEAECLDFERARSVFERALSIDYEDVDVWNAYLDMELKHGFKNSARNLLERVCYLLPRLSHFWLRYLLLEESENNADVCRKIFEKWISVEPQSNCHIWFRWLRFELRQSRSGASVIVEGTKPTTASKVDAVLVKLIDTNPQLLAEIVAFTTRSRIRIPLHLLNDQRAATEIRALLDANKAHKLTTAPGSVEDIVKALPKIEDVWNYDAIYDQIRIIQAADNIRLDDRVGAIDDSGSEPLNELAITEVRRRFEQILKRARPVLPQKRWWKKWFYICINYAFFEELITRDLARCEQIYKSLADIFQTASSAEVVGSELIHFNKFYRLWANFEVRRGNVQQARLIYGRAIGLIAKTRAELADRLPIFSSYIDMELRLDQVDRCRKIGATCVQKYPRDAKSWLLLIDIELLMNEFGRARKLFDIALANEVDQPGLLWNAYINVEVTRGDLDMARALLEKQFAQTDDWKVLVYLMDLEWHVAKDVERARKAILRAIDVCKQKMLHSERAVVTHLRWMLEKDCGTAEELEAAAQALPTRVRKRRKRAEPGDGQQMFEEFTAYIFPGDSAFKSSSSKMLEAAKEFSAQSGRHS